MLRVSRNQKVGSDIHASAGAFLERDDGEPIQEMIENLFTLHRGLFRDTVPYLRRRREDTTVVADLRESAQAADSSSSGERLQISVIDSGSKASRADLVKADVLGKLQRKSIRADGTVEGDEHLALLGVADALHVA